MKDCWQNTYATYKPDRETFYTKVKKVLDAINVTDVPQVPTETAPWIQQLPATKSAHAHLKPIFREIADLITSQWQTAWEMKILAHSTVISNQTSATRSSTESNHDGRIQRSPAYV